MFSDKQKEFEIPKRSKPGNPKIHNPICVDCIHDCKLKKAVDLLGCPHYKDLTSEDLEVTIPEDLEVTNCVDCGKPLKQTKWLIYETCDSCHEKLIKKIKLKNKYKKIVLIPYGKKIVCREELSRRQLRQAKANWSNSDFLTKYFTGKYFGKGTKFFDLSKIDQEIIRIRIRLFNLKRKGVI